MFHAASNSKCSENALCKDQRRLYKFIYKRQKSKKEDTENDPREETTKEKRNLIEAKYLYVLMHSIINQLLD